MSVSDRKAIAALDYLQVRGFYSSTYTRIVQPERIFAITDYYRRYWVPLLKPGPAWLVVALRQHCYWNSQRDWCTVSREALAQECGLAVRTVDNYLTLPLVDWFVTERQARYTARDNGGATRLQRDWTRYGLRLDEPLTPPHQAALGALAREMAGELRAEREGSAAELALAVAERMLAMTGEELMGRLEGGQGGVLERPMERSNDPQTIQQILKAAVADVVPGAAAEGTLSSSPGADLPTAQSFNVSLSHACDALYLRIVRPDKVHIATQYFRTQWLPLLGPARAWLILHLRARCYLNARQLEVRDTCTVAGLGELSAALGVSLSTVKTCLAEPPAGTFLTHLATHRPGQGQVRMTFRVEMIDPIREEDREEGEIGRLEDWEDGGMEEQPSRPPSSQAANLPGNHQQPENAASSGTQQPDFAGRQAEQQLDFADSPPGQEPESAAIPEQQPDFAGRLSAQKPDFTGIGGPGNGQILQNTKIPLDDSTVDMTQQQQVLIRVQGYVDDVPLAAAVGSLGEVLDGLQIDEPARSRLLALAPPMTTVLAWAIEALAQERIANKAGFIVSMLLGRYAPPPDLEQVAGVSLHRWRALAYACHQARASGGLDGLPAELDPLFWPLYDRLGRRSLSDWPIQEADGLSEGQDLPGFREPASEAERSAAGPEDLTDSRRAKPAGSRGEAQDLDSLWAAALERMRGQMLALTFDAYLRDTRLVAAGDDCWTIAAPYAYTRDWLSAQFTAVVRQAAQAISGRPVAVEFIVLE